MICVGVELRQFFVIRIGPSRCFRRVVAQRKRQAAYRTKHPDKINSGRKKGKDTPEKVPDEPCLLLLHPFNSGASGYLPSLPGMLLEPPPVTEAKFLPGGQSKTIRAECHHIPMAFTAFSDHRSGFGSRLGSGGRGPGWTIRCLKP